MPTSSKLVQGTKIPIKARWTAPVSFLTYRVFNALARFHPLIFLGFLMLSNVVQAQNANRLNCLGAGEFNANLDYFPQKISAGDQNNGDLQFTYFNSYKVS
jgi:hypothetical protein